MAIKYNVIQRGEPGVKGGGKRKFYAVIASDGELTIDEMVKEIEKFSALSEPDIRGVVLAMENVIQNKLADGKIIRMDKIGSFYPTLSSEGTEKEEEFSVRAIKSVGVNYRAGKRI
jgi:predicted histone-like DNA-binding protein